VTRVITRAKDERLLLHYMLLVRQIAKLSDSLLHLIRSKRVDKARENGYKRYAQTELSDIIMQVKKICDILELSHCETIDMGVIRYQEKEEEFTKKFPGEVWL
jgi:hypothetical protein